MNRNLSLSLSLGALSLLSVMGAGCPKPGGGVPKPGDPTYRDAVSAFYSAALAVQVNDADNKGPFAEKATTLAPGEPAAWANKALGEFRTQNYIAADASLKKAEELAPDNANIKVLRGLILEAQVKFDDAIKSFEAAAKAEPKNAEALYRIALTADRAKGPDEWKLKRDAYEKILAIQPGNVAALLFLMESLAGADDKAEFTKRLTELKTRSVNWPAETKQALAEFEKALPTFSGRMLNLNFTRLRNQIKLMADVKLGLRDLGVATYIHGTPVGTPFTRPLRLVPPPPGPAPADAGLAFAVEPLGATPASDVLAVALNDSAPPATFVATPAGLSQDGGAKLLPAPAGTVAMAALDINDEVGALARDVELTGRKYLLDLAVVGSGGLKLLKNGPGGFVDATAASKLPASVTGAAYTSVWTVDFEADGDLDLVLSPAKGEPLVLQNNGDGTFAPLTGKFPGVSGPLKGFAWADVDADGDPDAALIDANGLLHVFQNQRSGLFEPWKGAPTTGSLVALAVAETDDDAALDFLTLESGGSVSALTVKDGAFAPATPLAKSSVSQPTRLLVEDFDNNGGTDLAVAGAAQTELFLMGDKNTYPSVGQNVSLSATSVCDLSQDGVPDLAGLAGGKAAKAVGKSTKNYKSQSFTLVAKFPNGDPVNKINAYAIGGEIEARAGLLYRKLPLTGPQVHFGLGENPKVDAARVIWPNGNPQGEFGFTEKTFVADQRLGGSCPFLFTWDGEKMVFVTDCIWRSPLGLKINAQVTAGTTQTEDWVKIRGDQLKPKDGFYDLSITAELRETHYFDHVSLMAVDHPEDTEIWVDERFVPAKKPLLKVIPTKLAQPVQATGFDGKDASAALAERDGIYLDDFGRGPYQGITKDHWVTITLPDSAPKTGPLYLIAHGWLHPTDSSLNVALGQNKSHPAPSGLSLWTPDAQGNWKEAKPGLGFPEGKLKTVVLRIDDAFQPGAPRTLRLRTNLEVFWDQIRWAEGLPGTVAQSVRIPAKDAELRYRGFSHVVAKDASSPELPTSYENLAGTAPRWRDLTGYCTRFGDVRPLLTGVDDRYVIMNAGDEMRLQFPELPAPQAGFKRDFVLIADGWEKDGNVNTEWGQTVHPLPAHARTSYPRPGRLEDDPVYKAHASDWAEYHTRYISTESFTKALLP